MSKIIFLGANSFTGIYFKKFIKANKLEEDYTFIGVDIHEKENFSEIGIDYKCLNTLDKDEMQLFLEQEQADYIVNFIGTFYANNYEEYMRINTEITRNIFETIINKKLSIKNFLLIGSAAEYGVTDTLPIKECSLAEPVNLYGLSKLIQTQIARFYYKNFNVNMNVARTFNIIGDGISDRLSIGNFLKQIHNAKNGDVIKVGNLKPKRDYLHIEDVISAYWKILIHGKSGEIYNVSSGSSVSIEKIFDSLVRKSGKILHKKVESKFLKSNDIMDIYGDNSKLIKDTQWKAAVDILG